MQHTKKKRADRTRLTQLGSSSRNLNERFVIYQQAVGQVEPGSLTVVIVQRLIQVITTRQSVTSTRHGRCCKRVVPAAKDAPSVNAPEKVADAFTLTDEKCSDRDDGITRDKIISSLLSRISLFAFVCRLTKLHRAPRYYRKCKMMIFSETRYTLFVEFYLINEIIRLLLTSLCFRKCFRKHPLGVLQIDALFLERSTMLRRRDKMPRNCTSSALSVHKNSYLISR